MMQTKQSNSYAQDETPTAGRCNMGVSRIRKSEQDPNPKFYNPCPLDVPFVEPKGWFYKLINLTDKIFSFFANLFR